MGRPGDTREALIAEALGDFVKVLDRIDNVTPTLNQARDELEHTAAKLLGSVQPFRERVVTMALDTQNRAVMHITQQANLVARTTLDEQTRAMRESARRIFNDEVGPPLRQVASELHRANQRGQRPWDVWLTHAATAVTAASCTWLLLVYLAPAHADETKPAASAVAPDCAAPAARPEKARVRK
jgi:hypothetical protein